MEDRRLDVLAWTPATEFCTRRSLEKEMWGACLAARFGRSAANSAASALDNDDNWGRAATGASGVGPDAVR